jgi:glycosyltransferase involved in cell wall biosynthesis
VVVDSSLHATSPLREVMRLAPPEPAGMGAAIARLLSEPSTAGRLGQAARDAAATMSPRRHGEQILEIYRAAMERAPRRHPSGMSRV